MRWVLLLLLMSMMIVSPVQAQTQPSELEIEIHRQINDVRADDNLHDEELEPLKLHSVLIEVAREHSKDMLENDFFDHVNPDGEKPADRVSDAGVDYSTVGENLFYSESGSEDQLAESAVDGWVDSPGHFANIITDYAFTGIGVAHSGEEYYITQVFVNADPSHLENIGQIYENDELDDISEDDPRFQLTAQSGALIVIILAILIGLDASRRNNRYYGRN